MYFIIILRNGGNTAISYLMLKQKTLYILDGTKFRIYEINLYPLPIE